MEIQGLDKYLLNSRFLGNIVDSKQLGGFGEKIAINYLKNKGYQILDKNFSITTGIIKGEIDIVAKKDDIINFIEVKTLNLLQNQSFQPEEKVDFRKQEKIMKLAQIWLTRRQIPLGVKWQIDVIGIKLDLNIKKAKISHFKNINL